jgi:NADH-quinone oxidoreductase subunit G
MIFLTGALTSKPYAFTSRPWELRSVQSIDVLDGLGSNIRVDFKETEIVRILPLKNPDINENWINDKIRFFYDGLKRQRLSTPYSKINGKLTPLKWSKVLAKLTSLFKVYSFEYGSSKIGILTGSTLDTESLFVIRDFSLNYGISYLGIDKSFKLNFDNPETYKFQALLKDFEKVDYCLLIGTNPRFEASILNLRLRKIFRRGSFSLASIGGNFTTTFPLDFLGLSSKTVVAIAEGKHPICKALVKAKNPAIIYGLGLLERYDGKCFQTLLNYVGSTFFAVFKRHITLNLLHSDANTTGALELGIKPMKKDDLKGIKVIYSIGVENSKIYEEFKKISSTSILVFQNASGNNKTNLADIVLPSTTFVENSGIYYNTEGRPQKTQRALIGPNLSRDHWKIIRVLFQALKKKTSYFTKAQLRTELSKILPSSYFSNLWIPKNSFFTFGISSKEKLFKTSLKLAVEDFYMTHSLCLSSKTMAKASILLRSYSTNYKFLTNLSYKN